jgi:hypothetical protein
LRSLFSPPNRFQQAQNGLENTHSAVIFTQIASRKKFFDEFWILFKRPLNSQDTSLGVQKVSMTVTDYDAAFEHIVPESAVEVR